MKPILITLVVGGIFMINICHAQSICKDYREMTQNEKDAYVAALFELMDIGVIEGFVDYHVDHFFKAHRDERFLPWHRLFLKAFEEELQNENSNLAIPYWNWPDDGDTSVAGFWNEPSFLGEFNDEWNLDRSMGEHGGSLPTQSEINTVMALSNFRTGGSGGFGFGGGDVPQDSTENRSGDLEWAIHNPPHVWVGGEFPNDGVMSSPESPRDPIFYFHHSMVDMLWQEWEEETGASVFSGSSLNMEPFGTQDPHDYVDVRVQNVWYAQGGLVMLDDYETSGTNDYRYTGKIESEDFTVASGSDVTFTAGEKIVLGPGFKVESGSSFLAMVDSDVGNISLQMKDEDASLVDRIDELEKIDKPETWSLSQNYPNPFNPVTNIAYSIPERSHVRIAVYTITGQLVEILVDDVREAGTHTIRFDATALATGMYIYQIQTGSFVQSRKMTLVK